MKSFLFAVWGLYPHKYNKFPTEQRISRPLCGGYSLLFLSALCAATLVSCRTIDIQKKIGNDNGRVFELGSAGDPIAPDEQR
jgi:hypothetical protein